MLVQAHLRLLARVGHKTGSRSPDLLVVSVPVPVSVPAFPCFPVARDMSGPACCALSSGLKFLCRVIKPGQMTVLSYARS